ncbi:hypothetical protein M422DRAFT_213983 [Sphaerobolus stellatus SS14]|uniref:Unplaced genomic scaffold SPHSTscaffold_156, whole genome shotgun sequence n=1 Tax=Sphaerobolus stellatus (strain SS14) TaxID=990650 RepID=A0A0C9TPU4_SPHS4|nr:hypothetical protein M422DRAFT_213983 [Sphaerobolus stellatus SS14]
MLHWAALLTLPTLALSYSFELTSAPTQCGQVNLKITNGQGSPPYTALVVPFGANPTPDGEIRRIFQHVFSEQTTNFTMPYPANGGFVIALSDQNGIGTGGTSVPQSVAASKTDDSSCLIKPSDGIATFSFQLIPNNAINQCDPRVLAWNNNTSGDVHLYLIIPGGESRNIPTTNPTPQIGGTHGVEWTPNISTGTNIILIAGDSNGPGSGGSFNTAVGNNANGTDSCLNANSPSSTPGTAAGAVETGASGQDNSNTSTTSNIAAIAGGIVATLAAIIFIGLIFWFMMRRRRRRRLSHLGVDLLPEEGGPDHEFYRTEPFVIPSSARSYADDDMSRASMGDFGRRYTALSTTEDLSESNYTGGTTASPFGAGSSGSGSGARSNVSRKNPGGPMPMRSINVVQHEDAGELPGLDGPGETIELPPAYTSVGKSRQETFAESSSSVGKRQGEIEESSLSGSSSAAVGSGSGRV